MIIREMNIYNEALIEFGISAQVDMAIEEMSELIQALSKFKRDKGHIDNIQEEIADVEIMLEQMKMVFDPHNAISSVKKHKQYGLYNIIQEIRNKN